MAASTEKWFCDELSKLGIDATEENAQYILSMDDAEDLQEYMLSLLDGSDPAVRAFIPRLLERWQIFGNRPAVKNEKVYRKSDESQVYVESKTKRKKDRRKNADKNNSKREDACGSSAAPSVTKVAASGQSDPASGPQHVNGSVAQEELSEMLEGQSRDQGLVGQSQDEGASPSQDGGMVGQGARRKTKFVPLYSQQGKEKLVIKLPGRTQCECQALKHRLINNCTRCGRVVCEQEGAGPCLFCGRLVCTPEDQDVLARESKKSEKLRQYLMRDADKFTPLCHGGGERERELLPSVSARLQEGLKKAQKHKDRLIEYDKTSVRRTQVIDDECDYFSTDSNQWLSKNDREALRKREEELRNARHASRRDRKVTLDFAGRRVVEETNTVGQTMYDHRDDVVQRVMYGDGGQGRTSDSSRSEGASIINPSIVQPAPKFVSNTKTKAASGKPSKRTDTADSGKVKVRGAVIQDRELKEMCDDGMCLSMHQPWASLLVAGIKVHEGRSWYTAHRGRLWIAATAKSPVQQEVTEMENHYRHYYQDPHIDFPADYPVGCLLGCVDLVDCLSQEDYRQKFPDGESASPYVFICENPQPLVIKFPMKGKHKIYKLESTMHQAAKKGLR